MNSCWQSSDQFHLTNYLLLDSWTAVIVWDSFICAGIPVWLLEGILHYCWWKLLASAYIWHCTYNNCCNVLKAFDNVALRKVKAERFLYFSCFRYWNKNNQSVRGQESRICKRLTESLFRIILQFSRNILRTGYILVDMQIIYLAKFSFLFQSVHRLLLPHNGLFKELWLKSNKTVKELRNTGESSV